LEYELDSPVWLGVSQGGAISIQYAARHPERVSHLIIHGAYARGFLHRETSNDSSSSSIGR